MGFELVESPGLTTAVGASSDLRQLVISEVKSIVLNKNFENITVQFILKGLVIKNKMSGNSLPYCFKLFFDLAARN